LAGFQVTIIGRFWVTAEEIDNIYAYVASTTKVDVLKLEDGASAQHNGSLQAVAVNSIGEMDWKDYSARHIEMWYQFADEQRTLILLMDRQSGALEQEWRRRQANGTMAAIQSERLAFLPAHVFGWELTETSLALPHLVRDAKDFQLGLLLFNAKAGPLEPVFRFHAVDFKYAGREKCGSRLCRVYQLAGLESDQETAKVWVDDRAGYIVEAQSPIPNSPDWHDFRLRLLSVERLNATQWERKKSGLTEEFFRAARKVRK
jgi:hypothetical protein